MRTLSFKRRLTCTTSHEIPKATRGQGSHGNQPSHQDKKIIQLYKRLHNSNGQGIDFDERKKFKPFRPSHSKYANISNHHVCWYCGNTRHYHHSCPKKGHTWHGVPSKMEVTVQILSLKKLKDLRYHQ